MHVMLHELHYKVTLSEMDYTLHGSTGIFGIILIELTVILPMDDKFHSIDLNTIYDNHIACINSDIKFISSMYQSHIKNPSATPYPPLTNP